jgi:MFS family permease
VSGILVAAFQIFNMFISSIYYYLIVDVVPESFLGRFNSLMQIVGASSGFIFNYFIFGLAKMHMHEIFIGIALIYGVFITVMCLKVKEGEYPASDKKEENDHWWRSICNYGVECFGHPFYWLVFFVYSLFIWSNVSNVFNIFLFRDQIGLTLDQIGKLTAYVGVTSIIIIYPFGILIDRWGSHKSLIMGMVGFCVIRVASFFLVTDYWSLLVMYISWNIFWYLVLLSFFKWTVDLYPRKLYGQFASAGAMASSIGGAVLGPLCGLFFDWVHDYRYVLLWPVAFQLVGILVAVIIYRKWKSMGGKAGYQAQCDSIL